MLQKEFYLRRLQSCQKVSHKKVREYTCNLSLFDIDSTSNSLPRPTDNDGVIVVKLKRKVGYHGHVLYEPVRPRTIERF